MPFFEFIEPPSFREPVIPKDILPRDVASMPEVQLREYYNSKGVNNKDIELIISTRSSYKYSELSLLTNSVEIIEGLSHLSPSQLKEIVQAEIKLAKQTGDYSNLDSPYIEVAAQMSKGEIIFAEGVVNTKFFEIKNAEGKIVLISKEFLETVKYDTDLLLHIVERHGELSRESADRFLPEINIITILEEGMSRYNEDNIQINEKNGSVTLQIDMGKPIGYNRRGVETNILQINIDKTGFVRSCYPRKNLQTDINSKN